MRGFLLLLLLLPACATPRAAPPASQCDALARLAPPAQAQIAALAAVLEKNPRFALDFSRVGKQVLAVGHDTMVTFAANPSTTTEDIIFLVPAKGLLRAGLDASKLDPLPPPGKMVPGTWYYSSGRDPEPRFNNNALGTPMLMMAVDSDSR